MTLTRRTLFRGAFAACAFFATRRVLPGVEEEPRPVWTDIDNWGLPTIQTAPSSTHWLSDRWYEIPWSASEAREHHERIERLLVHRESQHDDIPAWMHDEAWRWRGHRTQA